ncbi:MAG: hypothetical protein ACXQTZ_04405 [Candidatus Alkanophagales archaeon]
MPLGGGGRGRTPFVAAATPAGLADATIALKMQEIKGTAMPSDAERGLPPCSVGGAAAPVAVDEATPSHQPVRGRPDNPDLTYKRRGGAATRGAERRHAGRRQGDGGVSNFSNSFRVRAWATGEAGWFDGEEA